MTRDRNQPLTAEQEARVARLTEQELARIDNVLLSHVGARWRKVAMAVSLAMQECEAEIDLVPDAFYCRRVAHLVAEGKLIASGDPQYMGYCEVKLR